MFRKLLQEYILLELMASDVANRADGFRKKSSQRIQVRYAGVVGEEDDTLSLTAKDPMGSGIDHECLIRIPELAGKDEAEDVDATIRNAIQSSDVFVFCDCADFRYKGFIYMANVRNYGIYPKTAPPNIRNPRQLGSVCKHMIACLRSLPRFIPIVQAELAKEAKPTQEPQEEQPNT